MAKDAYAGAKGYEFQVTHVGDAELLFVVHSRDRDLGLRDEIELADIITKLEKI